MKPSVAIQHIVLTFFFPFFIGQKGAVTCARIKPLRDTTVICSGKGFYLLTDVTCKTFSPSGAFNKNIFQFLKMWFF